MIELLFVTCLAASQSTCEEHRMLQLPEVGVRGCMYSAQMRLAEWTETHPGHRITRWSCDFARPGERET